MFQGGCRMMHLRRHSHHAEGRSGTLQSCSRIGRHGRTGFFERKDRARHERVGAVRGEGAFPFIEGSALGWTVQRALHVVFGVLRSFF